jgi:hypothetical protein
MSHTAFYDMASNMYQALFLGTGFKLLGGRDSARMFDVADNPISALMIGVLATARRCRMNLSNPR